jgi:hypothetical protein
MSDTTKIYSYLLGSLDHLISAYCLEYNINKEAALKYYIIPKLAKEFKDRGSSILTEEQFDHISESLLDLKLHKGVQKVINDYTETIRKVMAIEEL